MKDDDGTPMLKQWRIYTTSKELARRLSRRCDGSHEHCTLRGTRAEKSGHYSDPMAEIIIRAHRKEPRNEDVMNWILAAEADNA